jgi:hypothetical protein
VGRGPPSETRHTASANDAKLAQKLGQLQPFIAVFSCRNTWANLHLLGQPNTVLAQVRLAAAARRWWEMLPAPSVHNTADG